jgi:pimeloyl-ACP methyl ester carboxylesterase
MHVAYLHGFASSARSSKAAFFASRFARFGVELHTPDFNEPDFSTLTVSRMVTQVCDRIDAFDERPVVLMGSSLGGFVAIQSALQRPGQVDRLVLLAPALDFGGNRMRTLGDRGLQEWQRTNRLDVFHYGYGRVMPVEYALYADAQRYDLLNARLDIPTLVFQGSRDDAVDPEMVERWSNARPAIVELHMLDDDHQLLGSLEEIWRGMARFLQLPPQPDR